MCQTDVFLMQRGKVKKEREEGGLWWSCLPKPIKKPKGENSYLHFFIPSFTGEREIGTGTE